MGSQRVGHNWMTFTFTYVRGNTDWNHPPWPGPLGTACMSYFMTECPGREGFPGGSVVKNPHAMLETWVPSLGQEDSLEEEMATHSSILTWRISWTEEPGGLQSMGCKELDMTEVTEHACTPGKGHRTNKPQPIWRISEKSKGDTNPYVLSTFQNPSHWHPSWLSNVCATRKDPESEWWVRDNSETNPITRRP